MECKIEKNEKNVVQFTFGVGPERFEEGMKYSYNKNKFKVNLPGFRKGKVPRKIIETQFGKEFFYDDAIQYVLQDAYEQAVDELNLEVVSRPKIDVDKADIKTGVSFNAVVAVKPTVSLGQYKGLGYNKTDPNPSDEETEEIIKRAQEKNARVITVTDRAVQNGDIVTIDFKGFIDGSNEPFPGGEGKDYDLEIGSKTFIGDFEEQLLGTNVGDDVRVSVTFPVPYHDQQLEGKDAAFDVEIKDIKIKELPELNDEFAQDISGFDTLDEYKQSVKDKLLKENEEKAYRAKEEELMKKAIAAAQMEVPDVIVENEVDFLVKRFSDRLSNSGLNMEGYLHYMGQTEEELRNSFKGQAEHNVKSNLVLEEVVKAENVEISEEEKEAELNNIAAAYKIEADKLKNSLTEERMQNVVMELKLRKALDIIMDSAVETDGQE